MIKKPLVGEIATFKRKKLDSHGLRGFILDYNEDLTLLNILNDDYFINGFTIFRNRDISSYKLSHDADYYHNRVVRLKGIVPLETPKIDLKNWASVLATASELFPLITIHQEAILKNICYIGKIAKIKRKSYQLHSIDPEGMWHKASDKYRFKHLTKVDLGGNYEDALWRVALEDDLIPQYNLNRLTDIKID